MSLVPGIEERPVGPAVPDGREVGEGVAVEADEADVEDDAHLHPVLPVEEVLPLRVHQLERLLPQHHQRRQHQQDLTGQFRVFNMIIFGCCSHSGLSHGRLNINQEPL